MAAVPPTRTEFLTRYPAFTALSTIVVDEALAESVALLSSGDWGDFWQQAVMLDAAHTLTMDYVSGSSVLGGLQGAGGPISSVSGAGVSTSFASPPSSNKNLTSDWYIKTVYGQRFLRLRNTVIPPADISI